MTDWLGIALLVERWGGLVLFVSALAAPFLFPLLARRRAAGRPEVSLGAGAAGCLYAPVALWFAVCHGVYLGESPRARLGQRWAEPVIAALEAHRTATGQYPDSLGALVPAYLPDRASLELPDGLRYRDVSGYRREGDGFTLSFSYVGPGMNTCTHASREGRWRCGGYL